jgi:thiamine transport system permease protein
MYAVALVFFVFVIFTPPIYILSYAFESSFNLDDASLKAISLSFKIAAVVTFADVLLGLPLAWIISKKKTRFRLWIDTFVDMPLVVPTSILGISVYMFWGGGNLLTSFFGAGTLIQKGPLMIILLHTVFTLPYVVRSIGAAIAQINTTHEQAATMLGASPLTVFRTISLPLFKSGLISGMILAFTRSLSETGATMMVAGASLTAPVLVVEYKRASDIPSAAAVSIVLICAAILLLLAAKILSVKTRIPVVRVFPERERALSRGFYRLRNLLVAAFFLAVILAPTFFIALSRLDVATYGNVASLAGNSAVLNGIVLSFAVGLIVTAVNLLFALPLSMMIARNTLGLSGILDTMSDIVLLVPTSALGLSLALFWGNFSLSEFAVLALAHASFTFPLMLKPIATAVSGVEEALFDAARSLGAKPLQVFSSVTFPLIKPGIIAGVIMTFMRSLSETGATMSVSSSIRTIPVLLVELFSGGALSDDAVLACVLLFAVSFAFIFLLKKVSLPENA